MKFLADFSAAEAARPHEEALAATEWVYVAKGDGPVLSVKEKRRLAY
jgi:hypothetical protein